MATESRSPDPNIPVPPPESSNAIPSPFPLMDSEEIERETRCLKARDLRLTGGHTFAEADVPPNTLAPLAASSETQEPHSPSAESTTAAAPSQGVRARRGAVSLNELGIELGEETNRGGMGIVYKGYDHKLKRSVAIKFVLQEKRHNGSLIRRFNREAAIHARLQHPGVVTVYDFGVSVEHGPYLVMRHIQGKTLSDLLKERLKPRSQRAELLDILRKTAETVGYLHHVGLIHRDLKPGNIMVGRFGEVQVMDYGLARFVDAPESSHNDSDSSQPLPVSGDSNWDSIHEEPSGKVSQPFSPPFPGSSERLVAIDPDRTAPSPNLGDQLHPPRFSPLADDDDSDLRITEGRMVMGTPSYASPEQLQGAPVGFSADVHALGVILYRILTGEFPGTGPRRQPRQLAVRLEAVGVEPDLIDLTLRCLDINPANRPQDGTILSQELARIENERRQRLRQAELDWIAAQTRADAERRRRRLTLIVALLLAALGSGLALAIHQLDQIRQPVRARLDDLNARGLALRDQDETTIEPYRLLWEQANDLAEGQAVPSLARWWLAPELTEARALANRRQDAFEIAHHLVEASELLLQTTPIEPERTINAYQERLQTLLQQRFANPIALAQALRDRAPFLREHPARPFLLKALDHWASLSRDPTLTQTCFKPLRPSNTPTRPPPPPT